jgi:hypothetical protein
MAKQTFTTGQVLTAAQMSSLQQTAMGGGSPVVKTASYVLVAADAGTVIQMNSASATTITVNTALFAAGDSVQIQNIGAGVCTITAGTATVTTSGSLALSIWEGGYLYFTSASASIFFDYTQTGAVSPLTTKGDVWGYSSLDARIPVGANDTVLTADSTQALGLKWATPATGGMTLLSTTTLSGTTTTISSINQTYVNLVIYINNITTSASAIPLFRPNSSTSSGRYTITEGSNTGAAQTEIKPFGTSTAASNSASCAEITIFNYTHTNGHAVRHSGDNPSLTNGANIGGGLCSLGAITSIAITTVAGTATLGGTVLIYGVK